MAASQLLGLESYVTGPQPKSVSIHAEPLSWVVSVHNKQAKTTVAGYFGSPLESKWFEAMQLPISSGEDLSGLEVRLICVTPCQKNDTSVTEQTFEWRWSNEKYLMAHFEGVGIQSQRIKMRYARGSKLVDINMLRGTLRVRNLLVDRKQLEDVWRPPEPDENESHYPAEPANIIDKRLLDPPEPNEERFWRAMAAKRRRQ